MKKLYLLLLGCLCLAITHAQDVQLEWATSLGSPITERGIDITTDASENVYSVGIYHSTVDFDPGPGTFNLTSGGSADVYIQKLDASGNFVWAASVGSSGFDYGASVAVDASQNVYVCGYFNGSGDFDPGSGTTTLTTNGLRDVFVLKLDSNGNLLWAKSFGGTDSEYGGGVAVDAQGNVCITGHFINTVDFDSGAGTFNLTSNSAGVADAFVSKLDANGNFVWAVAAGGGHFDTGSDIAVDNAGNVYAHGSYRETVDFDPGPAVLNMTSSGLNDAYIWKLSTTGNLIWAKSIGGTDNDFGESIVVDDNGNAHITGQFRGVADFDPGAGTTNLTAVGDRDAYIQKLDANGNLDWVRAIGGLSIDIGIGIAIDVTGNCYATGIYQGTVDFDPGAGVMNLTAVGGSGWSDAYVLKLNANGDFAWVKSVGGINNDQGNSVAWANGNVYTTGFFENTADFDPGAGVFNLTSSGDHDAFVLKLSPQCTSPTPTTQLRAYNCGSTLPYFDKYFYADKVSGAIEYEWMLTDTATGISSTYINTVNHAAMLSLFTNTTYGKTYEVVVRANVGGVWGCFGPMCYLTAPSTNQQVTGLRAADCGDTVAFDQYFYADVIQGAEAYRFELTDHDDGMTYTWTNYNNHAAKMLLIPGTSYGKTYDVNVFAIVNGHDIDSSNTCTLSTIAFPTTSLTTPFCNYVLSSINEEFMAYQVPGANTFRYRFTLGTDVTIVEKTYSLHCMLMTLVPNWQYGAWYKVEVQAKVGNEWGPWGDVCLLCTPPPPAMPLAGIEMQREASIQDEQQLVLTPNPNNGQRINLNFDATASTPVHIEVMDMTGALLVQQTVIGSKAVVQFGTPLPTGIYLVTSTINGQRTTEKLIVN